MQFSLSRLFGLVTFSALTIAILMYVTTNYRERLRVRAQLMSMGAYFVGFGADNLVDSVSFHDPIKSTEIARFQSIEVLDFKEAHVTPESIENIYGLKNVQMIVFDLSDVRDEDIAKLKNINSLRTLWLSHTGVSDSCVDAIADIPGLEKVYLFSTQITQKGIDRLKDAKPLLNVKSIPKKRD